jgi:uncharacterized short protein YbdD (DUF466 family)
MICLSCKPSGLDLKSLAKKLRQGANLMIGQGDYDAYVAHREKTHPGESVMTREAYFLERQARRFGESGERGFRCC